MSSEQRGRPRLPGRSSSDRYLAGVVGGLSDRFQIDPFFPRIGLVGLTLFLAFSHYPYQLVLIAYVAGWLLLPVPPRGSLMSRLRRLEAWQEVGAAIACLILAIVLLEDRNKIGAVLLGGLAVLLLSKQRPAKVSQRESAVGDLGADDQREGENGGEGETEGMGLGSDPRRALFAGPAKPGRPPKRQRVRREPALWPLTLGLLVIWGVVAVILDTQMTAGLNPGIIVSGSLLIIGSVLLLALWRGRAGITLLWVLGLVPLWIAFSAQDVDRYEGSGSVRHAPTVVPDTGTLDYELGYGDLVVDLSDLELSPGSTTVANLALTGGTVSVLLPNDAIVDFDADVGLGFSNIWTERYSHSGFIIDRGISHTFAVQTGDGCEGVWMEYEQLMHTFVESKRRHFANGNPVVADDHQAAQDGLGEPYLEYWPEPTEVQTSLESAGFEVLLRSDGLSYGPTDWMVLIDQYGLLCQADREKPPPMTGPPPRLVVRVTIGLGTLGVEHD